MVIFGHKHWGEEEILLKMELILCDCKVISKKIILYFIRLDGGNQKKINDGLVGVWSISAALRPSNALAVKAAVSWSLCGASSCGHQTTSWINYLGDMPPRNCSPWVLLRSIWKGKTHRQVFCFYRSFRNCAVLPSVATYVVIIRYTFQSSHFWSPAFAGWTNALDKMFVVGWKFIDDDIGCLENKKHSQKQNKHNSPQLTIFATWNGEYFDMCPRNFGIKKKN